MRSRLVPLAAAVLLLAACSSNSETATTDTTGSATGDAAAGLGGAGGISSSGLGSYGAGGVQAGTQGDLEVNVGDRVYFPYDSSALDQAARQTLDRQAAWLLQFATVTVLIEGYTDERGTREYNLALGERRATEVRNYLAALGVPTARLLTITYGEERPADPGHDETAYALNRRAVTVVNVTN